MARVLVCALLFLPLAACGRKKSPPPAVTPTANPVKQEEPKVEAVGGVPQSLVDRITRDWPEIEKEGNAFLARFDDAQKAHGENDRDKMDEAIEAAQKHYENALEGWNGIYYSVDDLDEKVAEKCRAYMRTWNSKVDAWTKKAKALKEFSRVK